VASAHEKIQSEQHGLKMYLYVELWKARPEWYALAKEERTEYMAQVGPSLQQLVDEGIELLGFGLNETETPHRADYKYVAIWRIPEKKLVIRLESVVNEAGWHDYFDQANVRGWVISSDAALNDMVNMEETTQNPVEAQSEFK
jgi:hypothetical protein